MEATFYQQLVSEETALEKQIRELNETLEHVRGLKKHYESKGDNNNEVINKNPVIVTHKKVGRPKKIATVTNEAFPLEYEKGLTQRQTTYIAVHKLEKAFSDEISNQLMRFDSNEFPLEKAQRVARENASDLYKEGVFGAKKFGRKYKYYIKHKPMITA